MDETLCMLRHDGTERRYRAFALREKDEEAFTRQCAELGWRQVARSGEVHVFEAVGDAPGRIDEAPSLRYVRRRSGLRALLLALCGFMLIFIFLITRLDDSGYALMRDRLPDLWVALFSAGSSLAGACVAFIAGGRAVDGLGGANPLRRWWQTKYFQISIALLGLAAIVAFSTFAPLFPSAPLTAQQAAYTVERVYGVRGEFSNSPRSGGFFAPVQLFYTSSGGGYDLLVEEAHCRWEWVAQRVYESYARGEPSSEAEALDLEELSVQREAPDSLLGFLLSPYTGLRVTYRDGTRVVHIYAEPGGRFAPGEPLYEAIRAQEGAQEA